MKTHSLHKLLLTSLVFIAACGDSGSDSFPTPTEISEALLTVTDMPAGWKESQRQVFDVRDAENPSIDPSVWCEEAKDESADLIALAGSSGADVEMQYESESGMPRMMRLQAWANNDANKYFAAVKASAEACDGTTSTDESGAISETELSGGLAIGDQTVSWSQKTVPPTETQDEKWESIGRTTVATFGSVVMVLQLGDAAMTGQAELMSEDEWRSIAQLAANKLDQLE